MSAAKKIHDHENQITLLVLQKQDLLAVLTDDEISKNAMKYFDNKIKYHRDKIKEIAAKEWSEKKKVETSSFLSWLKEIFQ
jgi:hypothetical protein